MDGSTPGARSDGRLVAVVTGASSGIGEATARLLAQRRGAAVVLVARREERLRDLAGELGPAASYVAADLGEDGAPDEVRGHLEERHDGRLDLLVNNAGTAWRARFEDGGFENVRRTMALNFDAVVRLTEALLPLLRAASPSAIVNVASTAAYVARAGTGAYSASKSALVGWSDALGVEEREHGIHVGLVLPGFVKTEGFPATELLERRLTRWTVSTPERAAEAIVDVALERRVERFVPRPYAIAAALRMLAPRLTRTILAGGRAASLTTKTGADHESALTGASGNGQSPT